MQRDAGVLDLVLRAEIVSDPVRERRTSDDLAAEGVDDAARRTVNNVHGSAANLVDLVIVTDQAEAQVFGRFEQQLAAHTVAVALVGVRAIADIFDIAITDVVVAADAERDLVADWRREVASDAAAVEIAECAFNAAFSLERRLLGDDRDNARRGVLAEEGRLRAAQHFDALDVRKVRNLRSRTRTVDAVDEHADRRFNTGVVGAVAEAADDEVRVRRRLQLADAERRNDRLEVAQIDDFGFLDDVCADNRHSDRNVLQGLLTLGCRDGDGLQRPGFFFGFFLRHGGRGESCQRGNTDAEAKNRLKPAFAGLVGIVREHSEFPSWEFDLKR